jgi:nitrogen regulatory protein PII
MKRSDVIDVILKAGAQGVTLVESRGKGAGDRPMVGGARGTAKYIAGYNRIDTITTVVNDSKLDSVVSAIIDKAYTVLNLNRLESFLDSIFGPQTNSRFASIGYVLSDNLV